MSVFDKETRPREIVPEGRHTAILYSIVDLGSRIDVYDGVERVKHEAHLAWEFPDVLMSDGRPFAYGNTYTVTDGKYGLYFAKTSNLNKMLRSWTGLNEKACSKPGLLGRLMKDGTPCTISIVHEPSKKEPGKMFPKAESIKPFRGKDVPARVNKPISYSIDQDVLPEGLPDWQVKRIAESLERTTGVPERKPREEDAAHAGRVVDTDDHGIPF